MNVSWWIVDLDQAIVHSQIITPLSNWLWSFIDFIFSYFSVFMLLAFVSLTFVLIRSIWKNNKTKKNKSLDNK